MKDIKIDRFARILLLSIFLIYPISNLTFINRALATPPKNHLQSNVTSSAVTISWMTDIEEAGYINYGTTTSLGNIVYDDRGQSYESITHYVTIKGLEPDTTYYYDIISGGVTYNNLLRHFTVTTGSSLSPPSDTDIVYGQVFLNDSSTPAKDSIVYINLSDNDGSGTSGDSQICTSLVGSAGYWFLNLKNVRNPALDAYFDYSSSGDKLVLDAKGPDGGVASQVVDTSQDTPAPQIVLSPGYWTLNMTEMDWYENIAPYYSTGAATCQMILNYIREGAGEPLLTQDEIYEFVKNPKDYGTEMNPWEVDRVLGRLDPYDYLISNEDDIYDSCGGGNPFQGYNYMVNTYDPSEPDAMNEYMRDICHWMAYEVTKEGWWNAGELVARPNTPAAVPIFSEYHWVAVKGCVASEDPCPDPYVNPWYTPDFTVYGFWTKDPVITGIGQNTYKTASECESTYFLPLDTDDQYDGLYLQVAEPPAKRSNANVKIKRPKPDLANLEFIGVEVETHLLRKKKSWKDVVDLYLLEDSEMVSAFDETKMRKPILVKRLDMEDADYYLVPFDKGITKKGYLTSAVIILDAKKGYFREASWTEKPEVFLKVDRPKALQLIRKYVLRDSKDNKRLPPTYARLLDYIANAEAELVWEPNNYSLSPYSPYWRVDTNGYIWHVTQEGKVIPETDLQTTLQEIGRNIELMDTLLTLRNPQD